MMVMIVVMIIVVMMMMVMVVMMIVMMVMVMVMVVILGYNHRSFFRHSRIIAALVLGAQNLLGIRDGLQQFRK